jgi:hypothetical protein
MNELFTFQKKYVIKVGKIKGIKTASFEKLDENIVIPLCKFGCDELYEKGILVVQNGEFISSDKNNNENIKLYIDSINDKRCNYFNRNTSEYFKWHFDFHK